MIVALHTIPGNINCRVAYICNGQQPVISTHISADPLFFWEEENAENQ